jgi:hypothetical protein
MKQVLFFIWQLPQNLLGLAVLLVTRAYYDGGIWRTKRHFGICLGDFVIVNVAASITTIQHEKGHQKQSFYLGPIYLLAVGIPSAVFCNLWDRLFHRNWTLANRLRWYYSRYPENWADKLGSVLR